MLHTHIDVIFFYKCCVKWTCLFVASPGFRVHILFYTKIINKWNINKQINSFISKAVFLC